MQTIRLSTNWTLILKIFIPIAWITFFASFLLSSFLANPIEIPQLTNNNFRLGMLAFVLAGILFFMFTFFRIKRADADSEHIYLSNYFKTYRYTYESIDEFVIYDHILFKAVHILFKEKGSFGKRVIFLPKMLHFKALIEELGLEKIVRNK